MKLTATDYKKLKKRKRRERSIQQKLYLISLFDNCNYYPSPVVAKDKERNCVWISKRFPDWSNEKNSVAYYKRCYRCNHKGSRYRYYKRHANRAVRRYKGETHNGGSYKKCFDYWWEVD